MHCINISSVKYTHSNPNYALVIRDAYVRDITRAARVIQKKSIHIFKMKPTEPDVMKMTHHERDFLLGKIAEVLSDLQRLVCQLNSVQIEEEVSKSNVKILCQNVVAPSLNAVSNDVKYSIAFDCDLTSDENQPRGHEENEEARHYYSDYCTMM